ncbi:hypothetical protein RVIR1_14610 [Candidatus Rickettsiella viridis]|uniref:Uncharacterized protein n=1 Tax=Candidatus Rickettsiella viridis TaxID=676208 RepID=A0A2Z5UXQ3_9COXI|nr:hypothetical protein [Candidatus Rickettsiella viridis]BBB15900.1 hypothetical protein RVIR1_14610 [Candidatus Rickettsiella viridis]
MYKNVNKQQENQSIEKLNADITQLKNHLEEKEKQLKEIIRRKRVEREASRDTTAENRLGQALKHVLVDIGSIHIYVYPDTTIVTLPLMHKASREIHNLFTSFLKADLLKFEKIFPRFGNIEEIKISFPSTSLPDFEEGMRLSAGVDLSQDRCRIQADC